ncbi:MULTISPECIES: hypothetical protein [Kribbella]
MSQQYPGDTATITAPAGDSTQRYEEARAAASRAMSTITVPADQPLRTPPPSAEKSAVDPELLSYRGFKFGAAFFGWLITISMSVLLLAAVSAAAFGTAQVLDYTTSDAKAQPGAASITAAAVTIFMLTLAFYTGGYVAGRLARFDGGRQGFGVWMIAVLVGAVAGGLTWFLDNQYDVFGNLHRPSVALSDNTLLLGSAAAAAALLVLTLIAAIIGGKSGRRYHDRIDELL